MVNFLIAFYQATAENKIEIPKEFDKIFWLIGIFLGIVVCVQIFVVPKIEKIKRKRRWEEREQWKEERRRKNRRN